MEFYQLKYLDAIARHRSLTAAEELYMTQPALTKFLKKLEKDLGMELFHWTGGHMEPTRAGEEYIKFVRDVLERKEELERTIALERLRQKSLRVGIPFSRTKSFVPALLAFEKLHPDIDVELIEKPFPELEKMLDECKIDLAFTNSPVEKPNWEMETLWEEEMVLLVSGRFPEPEWSRVDFSTRKWVDLEQFRDYRFIVGYPDQMYGMMTERIFEEMHFMPKRVLRIRSATAALELVREGYGIAFFSRSSQSIQLDGEEAYVFGTHLFKNQFCSVYSKKIKDRSLIEEFIGLLRKK